jgi:hypothetical protein
MSIVFSDAFPSQANQVGSVSYRSNGGVVKAAVFSYTVPTGGIPVTTASRINLFLLPFNARIVYGSVFVISSFGTGFTADLVASDGVTDTVLWAAGVNLATVSSYVVDRPARGAYYTSPTSIPQSIISNGGIRIALAPTISGNLTANATLSGHFLYV